jgi:hypothetical protein
MFVVFVVTLHTPRVLAAGHNHQDELTSLFVALGFCGASLLLAASLGKSKSIAGI